MLIAPRSKQGGYIGVGNRRAAGGRQFVIPTRNLAARFDANQGITSAAGFASQWNDISGNARHLLQATGANQPIHLPYSGVRSVWLPGVSANYVSSSVGTRLNGLGSITIIAKARLQSWVPGASYMLVSKSDGVAQSSFAMYINGTGNLLFFYSPDGTTARTATASAATGISAGSEYYVGVEYNHATGKVNFYKSVDGVTWVLIGIEQTITAGSIFDSTAPLELGSYAAGLIALAGNVFEARVYSGFQITSTGTLKTDAHVHRDHSAGTTWVSSTTGETYTINSTGSKPAQMVDRPSLLLDGVAHFMKVAFALIQPETIYFVGKQVTWTINDYIFDGGSTNKGLLYLTGATPQLNIYAGTSVAANTDFTVGATKVACVVFNGASSSLKINAAAETSGNAGSLDMGGFTLGANGDWTGANCGNIQAHEVLIYKTAHDAATRANIIRALMAKWGVA